MRTAARVDLSNEDRDWLEKLVRSRVASVRLTERATVVLLAADGLTNKEIALKLAITAAKAGRWRGRFVVHGRKGIEQDAPGRGRKATYSAQAVLKVVRRTTSQKPEGATHWSRRAMAKATNMSATTIGRIWHVHGL